MIMVVTNIVPSSMLTWSAVTTWDFSYNFAYIAIFIRVFLATFAHLILVEYCILKYLIEFLWKRIPPLDQSFTTFCISLVNLSMSFAFAIVEVTGGNLTEFNRLIGENVLQKPVPLFSPQ